MSELRTIVAGLAFPECPRWHAGCLWFSDMHADQVFQVSAAGNTLVVAESWGNRLTAFSIAADGTLGRRRVWAELGKLIPDGICLDAEGCIWVSACANHACVRVREGGEIVQSIDTGDLNPFACMLGGADGKTLFMCNSGSANPQQTLSERSGRIDCVRVSVPAAPGG